MRERHWSGDDKDGDLSRKYLLWQLEKLSGAFTETIKVGFRFAMPSGEHYQLKDDA
jgi:hypothetical protein